MWVVKVWVVKVWVVKVWGGEGEGWGGVVKA